jgi:hypothetical protein
MTHADLHELASRLPPEARKHIEEAGRILRDALPPETSAAIRENPERFVRFMTKALRHIIRPPSYGARRGSSGTEAAPTLFDH